ncbi:Cdc6/Cdc18 family protein [Natronocalculus amylovorans]|uniref:ORC1-type DNA replication protein n=1 Tax=Natronocalculus amylovorans TaxID=2917812 RepID=A0AAE3K9S5_9EURY|nr:orc1/cdc6 family replication initiation protein [Natronocalculus amylovorans]MCL9818338.1 orc1/cdc6 family replication initiation protein [Natronocalculus amylovorans]
MGLESFTRNDPIFADESVLRDNYRPTELIERDAELSAYQSALRPVINGAPPKNIFIYGQTGVGKTLATRLVSDRLLEDQRQYDDLEIKIVSLNCKSVNSSYQIAVNLVNTFREPSDYIPSTGYPPSRIYQMLWDHLNALGASHLLVILDEIDSIGTNDDILYELPRANDNEHVDDTYIGVIGISNDFTFRDNLSARVKDSLCDEELHFPPYDANNLRHILERRAEKAFREGVLEEGVIPLCAARAANESGSARMALQLLYKAGDLARQRDAVSVCEAFVDEARQLLEEGKIKDELARLPVHSKVTLRALTNLHKAGETPVKRRDIYALYLKLCDEIGSDPVTDRTIHDRISQLRQKGFVEADERNDGISGGSYYLYDLRIIPEMVDEALDLQ